MRKTDADSSITIYKVFDKFKVLTTMRFSHSYRCLESVRIMLVIAAFYEIWQMDVKTAFLNGYLKEELYMMQPEGFVNPKGASKVYKLQRSIYGLVQALGVGIHALIV